MILASLRVYVSYSHCHLILSFSKHLYACYLRMSVNKPFCLCNLLHNSYRPSWESYLLGITCEPLYPSHLLRGNSKPLCLCLMVVCILKPIRVLKLLMLHIFLNFATYLQAINFMVFNETILLSLIRLQILRYWGRENLCNFVRGQTP